MSDDWRLMGQETYLQSASFVRKPYRMWSATWEHEHCEFCTRKFMERGSDRLDADTLTAGYAAIGRGPEGQDDYYWVCEECFKDFRARFEWNVVPSGGQ